MTNNLNDVGMLFKAAAILADRAICAEKAGERSKAQLLADLASQLEAVAAAEYDSCADHFYDYENAGSADVVTWSNLLPAQDHVALAACVEGGC